jgi:hypothetical protein
MGTNNRTPEQRERMRRMAQERFKRQAATQRIDQWSAARALPSPTIGDALLAGHHWLKVFCPGCQTSNTVDLRRIDRHPGASVEALTLSLKCSWCRDSAPMPRLLGLYCEPAQPTRDTGRERA